MSTPKKQRTKEVKLYGGPVSGQVVRVPGSAKTYRVGRWWTYEFAGKDGRQEMFALRSNQRVIRRLIRIGMRAGRPHPLVEREFTKPRPVVGSTPSAGRGRRRREAARAARVPS